MITLAEIQIQMAYMGGGTIGAPYLPAMMAGTPVVRTGLVGLSPMAQVSSSVCSGQQADKLSKI